jgi:hypothetical protein
MKLFFMTLAAIIPSSICIGGAVYMAVNGISGWGWFLFVGVLVLGVLEYRYTEK